MKTLIHLIFLIGLITWRPVTAQDQLAVAVEMIATQRGDQGIDLKVTVTDDENSEPVKGLMLRFTGAAGDKTVDLGEATTNGAGVAELKGGNLEALRTAGRSFVFKAVFAGNDEYGPAEASLEITDVKIILTVEVVDSVNTIKATVTSWNEKSEEIPFAEGEVKIYVPRMFSLLPIGDITTDDDGYGEFEFPVDLPGDINGELTVIARIEEHETFGNAEATIATTWGVKADAQASRLPRALWSPDAPLWMVITFTILMVGVWYHYGLIVYELIKVKRLSKASDAIDYSE